MKIQLYSDIHNEFRKTPFFPHNLGSDVLVLAGDINANIKTLEYASKLAGNFKHIIVVFGNHEFYGCNYDTVINIVEKYQLPDNVHLLHFNNEVVIDNVSFIGATLWTDCNYNDPSAKIIIKNSMADYSVIFRDGKCITPDFTIELHKQQLAKLIGLLNNNKAINKPTVVITHHAPSFRSIHPRYQKSNINGGWCSDLNKLFYDYSDILKLWLHGHCHDRHDYTIENTRIICNPVGYPNEYTGYVNDPIELVI